MLRLRINTAKLKEILSQVFDSGFYGSAELKDEVVESALAQCEVTEEVFTSGATGSIEITIGNWIVPASAAAAPSPQTGVQSMGMPIGTIAPDGSVGGVMPSPNPTPTFIPATGPMTPAPTLASTPTITITEIAIDP